MDVDGPRNKTAAGESGICDYFLLANFIIDLILALRRLGTRQFATTTQSSARLHSQPVSYLIGCYLEKIYLTALIALLLSGLLPQRTSIGSSRLARYSLSSHSSSSRSLLLY